LELSPDQKAAFAKAVEPVLEEYAAAVEAKGLPGRSVLADIREILKNR